MCKKANVRSGARVDTDHVNTYVCMHICTHVSTEFKYSHLLKCLRGHIHTFKWHQIVMYIILLKGKTAPAYNTYYFRKYELFYNDWHQRLSFTNTKH